MADNQPVSAPAQNAQPSRALSPAALTAIVVGAFVATLAVFGSCAGIVYLGTPRVRDAMEQVNMPVPAIRPNVNDWWTQRVLSEVYTSALDTVVADQAVQEKLGEPIETDVAAEDLFVRVNEGELDESEEAIEFDVIGPQGRGTVRITASGTANMARATPIEIKSIAVTLEDGTVIDVEPPAKRDVQIR
jgi:hypothetical protein